MKIAVVRGDFLSGWELPIFEPWLKRHEVTIFTGRNLVGNKFVIPKEFKVEKLWSPVDLNFGHVKRPLMAVLNRVFTDAHVLFGLEEKLRGFDVAYTAETFYNFSRQCVRAKNRGYAKAVVMHVGENIAFNNEGIWGRKALKQEVIAGVDKFICITDKAREVLITEGADPHKITRIDPGVDLTRFKQQKKDSIPETSGFRVNASLQNDKKIRLLTVSRLVPEKGIREMTQTFKKLRQKFPDLELVVVGVGPEEKYLSQPGITHLSGVAFEEIPAIYNSTDIYIHYPVGSKTWEEQWGFVLAEAMACGLPVVALNRGSVGEVLKDAGYLVNSQKEFQETLEKLIRNKNLRQRTQKIIYDAKDFSLKIEKVFNQCLK